MRRHRRLVNGYVVQLAIMLLLRMVTFAQGDAVRTPISSSEVAGLLNREGFEVQPSQVHLPARILGSSTSPDLRLVSADRLGNDRMLVGVRCETAGDCLPFNVTVDNLNEKSISDVKSRLRRNSEETPTGSQVLKQQTYPVSVRALQSSLEAKVMVGSQVALIIRDDRMEIHLPAVAIDCGAPGTRVRVRTSAPDKIFSAVVLDRSTVLGGAQ